MGDKEATAAVKRKDTSKDKGPQVSSTKEPPPPYPLAGGTQPPSKIKDNEPSTKDKGFPASSKAKGPPILDKPPPGVRAEDSQNQGQKGQRYYLYDKELKRPTDSKPVVSCQVPQPRPYYRPRLPFHKHEYVGIYPTADDERFERQLLEKRQKEMLIYSRPPDTYHLNPSSSISFSSLMSSVRSERRYNGERSERSRREYESSRSRRHYEYDGHHSSHDSKARDRGDGYGYHDRRDRYHDDRYGSSSTRSYRKSDPVNGRSSRDYYYSSTRRYSESGRSRTRSYSSERGHTHPDPEIPEPFNEFDLNIEIHPLIHFIDDKPKLLKEALGILKGRKLDAMIPPIFTDLNARELEETLLDELKTLNIATIANVIDGKLVNSELANSGAKSRKSKTSSGVSVTKIKKKLKEVITEVPPKKKRKRKESASQSPKKVKKKHKKKKKKVKGSKSDDDNTPAGPGLPPQKTLMELLELEYRAKAIKALLKSQDIEIDSSRIDNALLSELDQAGFDPDTRPIVDDPRPLAPPTSRFLVDNTYIYPMQIKLEFEEPPPEIIIDEATFPPSPDLPATAPATVPNPEGPSIQSSQLQAQEVQAQAQGQGQVSLHSSSNTFQEMDNMSPPPKRQQIVITLDSTDEDSMSEDESDAPHSESASARAHERAKILELCGNEFRYQDQPFIKTEPDTEVVSELEEGEFDDEVEWAADVNRVDAEAETHEHQENACAIAGSKAAESAQNPEVEDIGSNDESDDENPAQTYVRQCPNVPALTPMDLDPDRDMSPPRRPAAESRPFRSGVGKGPLKILERLSAEVGKGPPKILQRLSAEVEDISSEDSADEILDDGIIIGGFDPTADPDPDPILITLPLPFHTCEPKPEGFESGQGEGEDAQDSRHAQEEEDENMAYAQNPDDEDEDTNPRTWFNRWYNSKKVQKNVKSSKMVAKLRSKLRREKAIPEPLPPEPTVDEVPIIGSITEYQSLFASGKYKAVPEPEVVHDPVEPDSKANGEAEEEELADEADDDALWGDIIG